MIQFQPLLPQRQHARVHTPLPISTVNPTSKTKERHAHLKDRLVGKHNTLRVHAKGCELS
jgi:hypothetical protein